MHERRAPKIDTQVIQKELSTYPPVIHRIVEDMNVPIEIGTQPVRVIYSTA